MSDKPGGRRVSLPLVGKMMDLLAPPTVDAMRARLGGRAASDQAGHAEGFVPRAQIGDVVRTGDADPARVGVVLCVDDDAVDVFAAGKVRRTRGDGVRPWLGPVEPLLARIAEQARAFGGLVEGDWVQFSRTDEAGAPVVEVGMLLERCRWGALVQRADSVVLGVGFQRLCAVQRGDRPS